MNISTQTSRPSKTKACPSPTQARSNARSEAISNARNNAISQTSNEKQPSKQIEGRNQQNDTTELSAESRETPATGSQVENLLEGMSSWATEPAAESPSLELREGQLLGQGRSADAQQVTQLQELLNSRGQQLEVDGEYGPLTAEAVRSVQAEMGVTVDGIVGPETMAALNSTRGSTEIESTATQEQSAEVDPVGDQAVPSPSGRPGLEGLPPRSQDAMGGQDFMNSIEHLGPGRARNEAVLNEILSGNVPENSRSLQNITVERDGRQISMDVMPDYLSIGSNEDNVRIPMTPAVAQAIADRTGMSLPTDRIVDDIHAQARQLHLDPMGASSQMSSIGWYADHDGRIDRQLGSGQASRELVSGHKKDLVIPARDGRVAIYGGRWADGRRIQSYSNVHSDTYEDYSHGARLISQRVTVDGQSMTLADALADPNLRGLFTNQ